MSHIAHDNTKLLARVRRIGGQVGAIERALQAEADCAEVLHLVAAVRGAVNGLLDEVIAEHLEAHVAHEQLTASERHQGAQDLLAVIRRYSK